jgi:protein NrfD
VSLGSILYLFLTHLGVGVALTLLLVSRDAGVKFFRFNAGLALALILAGLLFRPGGATALADFGSVEALSATLAAAALLVYWLSVGRGLQLLRPVLLPLAAAAGFVAVVTQALGVSAGASVTVQGLTVASFVTSAGLLGGACTAMILGHWYLVVPSMDVLHLQSIVKFHIGSLVLRAVLVGAAAGFAIVSWQPGAGPSFERYIFSVGGIFFWQRVLFGLAGPALLAYLTWETAKIRSTQSATGILYVDFFTVIVGELLAKYLLLSTRVPV